MQERVGDWKLLCLVSSGGGLGIIGIRVVKGTDEYEEDVAHDLADKVFGVGLTFS